MSMGGEVEEEDIDDEKNRADYEVEEDEDRTDDKIEEHLDDGGNFDLNPAESESGPSAGRDRKQKGK